MQLKLGQIHDVVSALSALEDPEIKLSGETVLSMAITLNALRPLAAAYEQARARTLSNMMKEGQEGLKNNQEIESDFMEKDYQLREGEREVDIKSLSVKELGLDSNPKIRPITVARLMPILAV